MHLHAQFLQLLSTALVAGHPKQNNTGELLSMYTHSHPTVTIPKRDSFARMGQSPHQISLKYLLVQPQEDRASDGLQSTS